MNMALIKCPECNHEVSDTAKNCPNCGYKLWLDIRQGIMDAKEYFYSK